MFVPTRARQTPPRLSGTRRRPGGPVQFTAPLLRRPASPRHSSTPWGAPRQNQRHQLGKSTRHSRTTPAMRSVRSTPVLTVVEQLAVSDLGGVTNLAKSSRGHRTFGILRAAAGVITFTRIIAGSGLGGNPFAGINGLPMPGGTESQPTPSNGPVWHFVRCSRQWAVESFSCCVLVFLSGFQVYCRLEPPLTCPSLHLSLLIVCASQSSSATARRAVSQP